jgi:hypothetical protein
MRPSASACGPRQPSAGSQSEWTASILVAAHQSILVASSRVGAGGARGPERATCNACERARRLSVCLTKYSMIYVAASRRLMNGGGRAAGRTADEHCGCLGALELIGEYP